MMKKKLYSYLFLILSVFSLSTAIRCEDSYVSKVTLGGLTLLVGHTLATWLYEYFNKKDDSAATIPGPSQPRQQVISATKMLPKMPGSQPAQQKIQEKYQPLEFIFFWRIQGDTNGVLTPGEMQFKFLSQWYFSPFNAFNTHFKTAEHFMMYFKALHFAQGFHWQGNRDIAAEILQASTGEKAKNLGKTVKGLISGQWDEVSEFYVYAGNMEKFSQNPLLKQELLSTGNKFLAEASPYDKVWGIGLRDDEQNSKNPQQWQGANKLGYVLMMVRAELQKENGFRPVHHQPSIRIFVQDVKNENSQMMTRWKRMSNKYKQRFDAIKEKR